VTNTIYTVYQTTNQINNKIYIGVHATNNPNDDYLGSGISLNKSIKKYGKENFEKEILFEYDNQNEAYLKENEIVNQKFIDRKDTYNICFGGKGASYGKNHPNFGKQHSQETKDKMSKSHKDKIISQETKDKMSKSHRGTILSQETKDKISKIHSGKIVSKETKDKMTGKNNPTFSGYYVTPWGKFESAQLATQENISRVSIQRWCKNSDKIISKLSYTKSQYLQSLQISPIGKTFKEIGFHFISN